MPSMRENIVRGTTVQKGETHVRKRKEEIF
jgi:hypothetical protein